MVQLRDDIVQFCSLTADAGQRELSHGLGKPHSWPLGPERRKPHGHSCYLHWLRAFHCLRRSSGSRLWYQPLKFFCGPGKGQFHNECWAALSKRVLLGSGCMAAMKNAGACTAPTAVFDPWLSRRLVSWLPL